MMVSVIVPVYNVERYLDQCIQSILNQTYRNLEILLIDDGSTDRSGEICDMYANMDERIQVIHQQNMGLSEARNTGLKKAAGEYIAFVDSDDWIIETALETLVIEAISYDLDIVAGNGWQIFEDGGTKRIVDPSAEDRILSGIEHLCKRINEDSYIASVWLNLYKRSMLSKWNLTFERDLTHEDEQWTPRTFLTAQRVKQVDVCFYCYRMRENSITHQKDRTKHGLDMLKICYELDALFQKETTKKQYRMLKKHLLAVYLGGVYVGRLDRPDYRNLIRKTFVLNKVTSIRDLAKVVIFLIDVRLYNGVNRYYKQLSIRH